MRLVTSETIYCMNLPPHSERPLGPYIGIASRVMEKRINENFSRGGYDLNLHHFIILVHLWKQDGQNQKTLCEFAGRNKTTITRSIDNLERDNFVLRVPDSADRRNKLIYLTHKGKEVKNELVTIMEGTMNEATAGIAPEEIDICKKVLYNVILNLGDSEEIFRFSQNSNK